MAQYIDKNALMAEIEKRMEEDVYLDGNGDFASYIDYERYSTLESVLSFVKEELEVIDPYEECVQYDSVKAGIQAHAETYSFNVESDLFNQLTKEQQELWRKEIEQAYISGGDTGVELARDQRYKENVEVKEVDYERELSKYVSDGIHRFFPNVDDDYCKIDSVIWQDYVIETARHFFELGLKAAQKGE